MREGEGGLVLDQFAPHHGADNGDAATSRSDHLAQNGQRQNGLEALGAVLAHELCDSGCARYRLRDLGDDDVVTVDPPKLGCLRRRCGVARQAEYLHCISLGLSTPKEFSAAYAIISSRLTKEPILLHRNLAIPLAVPSLKFLYYLCGPAKRNNNDEYRYCTKVMFPISIGFL
ncbi:hypothetical protein BH11PAT3_BH11PAT3_2140 [soil metagenome]